MKYLFGKFSFKSNKHALMALYTDFIREIPSTSFNIDPLTSMQKMIGVSFSP